MTLQKRYHGYIHRRRCHWL